MFPKKHWTPRYIACRLALVWYGKRHPDDPWLPRGAISLLSDWLRKTDQGVEWGSGRSTAWIASRTAKLTSIEHHPAWHEKVKQTLADNGLANVDYRHVPADPDDPGSPDHPYVAAAASLQRGGLDFALVDGLMRDHCMLLAMDLLKPGGLLILDNANWYVPHATHCPVSLGAEGKPKTDAWGRALTALSSWRMIWVTDGVTATFFTVKPPA